MADIKSKFQSVSIFLKKIMNLSYGGGNEGPVTDRSYYKNANFESRLNETSDFFSKTSTKFNNTNSKKSLFSPRKSSFSRVNTSMNESRNNLFDANSISLKKSKRIEFQTLESETPVKRNSKHEFLQIKYSDILGKRTENSKSKGKNSKFLKLLMVEDDKGSKQKSNNFSLFAYDQIKTNNNKNRFMKELQMFSHSMKIDTESKKVAKNKPAISIKSTADTKTYFAFSPTARKSLIHTNPVIRHGPLTTQKEKYSSIILGNNKPNDLLYKSNGYLTTKIGTFF